ncbi:hypothetical protein AALP_AA6G078100 [Arabis alpina]|uniref:Uncharacterized protein n=1 Tax=Arabis alpina TaxID=50452 RepID=A0A087GMR8_ARAAL|nr:hypothetical protein AALP_AA6G078100 [Arabis alpina]
MASLTPGVLSTLLNIATGNSVSSPSLLSSHRSPLLQVIEIVPCLSDDQWRSDGFFIKVSDSLHAAYVAVSSGDDADLIRSNEISLGQFVYILGGLHVEKDFPVPIIRGLKPVPKRRVCIGNPSDLVSSDLLLPFTQVSLSSPTMTMKKTKNLDEKRRLSLDSSRRSCWDQSSPVTRRRDTVLLPSSPRLKPNFVLSDKKPLKNEKPSKQLNCGSSTFSNRNVVKPPISMTKSPKDGNKLLSKVVSSSPVAVFKLPMTWSDQRIVLNRLPKPIQLLGKEVSSHRQVAVSTAVSALEEAFVIESVLLSLQAFSELCDSSKKLSTGQVVFRSVANKNAASWVQAAVVTGFSQFDLFKEDDAAQQDHQHYIVLQNSSEKLNPKETTGPRKLSYNGLKPPSSMKHCSVSNRSRLESKSKLKDSATLADELIRVSSQWFLKYLESSLNKGFFFSVKKEEANGKESLLVHLKALNRWLDDLILNRTETSEKVEDLRKKLQRFLLEHIESAMRGTRKT